MSSLQKFHRRTQSLGPPPVKLIGSEAPVAGAGFYLGFAGDGTSYMYVSPKSTELFPVKWGSYGTARNTISTTDGIANTNTLYAFGNSITTGHPAAYYCRTLTAGGYNTWYLPARAELNTLYSNKSATPFATANSFVGNYYWSSTEKDASGVWGLNLLTGTSISNYSKSSGSYGVRAVRRSTI